MPDRGSRAAVVVRSLVAAIVLVLLVLLVFVGGRALRRTDERAGPVTYDEGTRRSFLEACVQGGGAGSEAVCGCAYERLVASVPFNRYLELEDQARRRPGPPTTAAGGTAPGSAGSTGADAAAGTAVPDELESILVDCVAFNRQLSDGARGTGPGATGTG